MISESDGYKCKAKEWEIEEELTADGDYPQISVEGSYEFFPYSKTYSWDEDVVEETIGNRKIRYKRELYYARGVILEDGRGIHIDGRNAPNSDELSEKCHAKYNGDDPKVVTYTIEEIDENGNVVFSHLVDSMPDIVHDIADYLGIADDGGNLPF